MTKVDIFSGFLGAGKTTLIKKLIAEAYRGQQLVLIENEFGEIGIDGGFMAEAGIQVNELNSGCICCSLVGDFARALTQVVDTYHPDRILIEPSGVGKLSDIIRAVQDVEGMEVNSAVVVCDANKCKLYIKNFGEFYDDQVRHAGAIVLSRTGGISEEKLHAALDLLRERNPEAVIITTPWDQLDGAQILQAIERTDTLEKALAELAAAPFEDEDECDDPDCSCHHHHHHDHDEGGEHEHHHHHDHDEDEEHEHHHHRGVGDLIRKMREKGHTDDEIIDRLLTISDEHHRNETEEEREHDHGVGHLIRRLREGGHSDHGIVEELLSISEKHHRHDHDHEEEHEHHHHHHHHGHDADEIFLSWGVETAKKFTEEELRSILKALDDSGKYGAVLRAKGIVDAADGQGWLHFDHVPEEAEVRRGPAGVTGRLCVIGSDLKEAALKELFGV